MLVFAFPLREVDYFEGEDGVVAAEGFDELVQPHPQHQSFSPSVCLVLYFPGRELPPVCFSLTLFAFTGCFEFEVESQFALVLSHCAEVEGESGHGGVGLDPALGELPVEVGAELVALRQLEQLLHELLELVVGLLVQRVRVQRQPTHQQTKQGTLHSRL